MLTSYKIFNKKINLFKNFDTKFCNATLRNMHFNLFNFFNKKNYKQLNFCYNTTQTKSSNAKKKFIFFFLIKNKNLSNGSCFHDKHFFNYIDTNFSDEKNINLLYKPVNDYLKTFYKTPIQYNSFFNISSDTDCYLYVLKFFYLNSSLNIVLYFNKLSSFLRLLDTVSRVYSFSNTLMSGRNLYFLLRSYMTKHSL